VLHVLCSLLQFSSVSKLGVRSAAGPSRAPRCRPVHCGCGGLHIHPPPAGPPPPSRASGAGQLPLVAGGGPIVPDLRGPGSRLGKRVSAAPPWSPRRWRRGGRAAVGAARSAVRSAAMCHASGNRRHGPVSPWRRCPWLPGPGRSRPAGGTSQIRRRSRLSACRAPFRRSRPGRGGGPQLAGHGHGPDVKRLGEGQGKRLSVTG